MELAGGVECGTEQIDEPFAPEIRVGSDHVERQNRHSVRAQLGPSVSQPDEGRADAAEQREREDATEDGQAPCEQPAETALLGLGRLARGVRDRPVVAGRCG